MPTIQEELQKNGSPRAVFMTDDDRRAVTVEIPIHPAFLSNPAFEDEKSDVSVRNPLFKKPKSAVSTPNPAFEEAETVQSSSKTMIEGIVESMTCTERVKKNILLFYRENGEKVFSRADVMEIVGLSDTSAGDLIQRLKKSSLIEPVTGHGKGKYRFIGF